jgi:hypothetical protein
MGDKSTSDYDCEDEIMPRVNLALSDEAKAVLDAFQKEKGLRQDDAANALLLEFAELRLPNKSYPPLFRLDEEFPETPAGRS